MKGGYRPTTRGGSERVVKLPGRRIGIAFHGDPDGYPVFVAHGTPASRLGHEFTNGPARERGVRIICPDRPGIGLSDPEPNRTVASWAEDVSHLADVLGTGRFGVLGYSGGGPYALACGAGLKDRITAVALMAGVGPPDRPGARERLGKSDLQMLDLSTRHPRVARLVLRGMYTTARFLPGIAFNSFLKELSEPDREVAKEQGPDAIVPFFLEALRQGPEGVRLDYQLWEHNWNFAFEDVRSHVDIWQGDADELVPVHHAKALVRRLSDATLHLLPHTGHVSIQHHIGTILDGLLGHRTSIQKNERRASDGNRNP